MIVHIHAIGTKSGKLLLLLRRSKTEKHFFGLYCVISNCDRGVIAIVCS